MQFVDADIVKADGAFLGWDESRVVELGPVARDVRAVNSRTTCYAIVALLIMESPISDIWLGNNNKVFTDPCSLKNLDYKLIW